MTRTKKRYALGIVHVPSVTGGFWLVGKWHHDTSSSNGPCWRLCTYLGRYRQFDSREKAETYALRVLKGHRGDVKYVGEVTPQAVTAWA